MDKILDQIRHRRNGKHHDSRNIDSFGLFKECREQVSEDAAGKGKQDQMECTPGEKALQGGNMEQALKIHHSQGKHQHQPIGVCFYLCYLGMFFCLLGLSSVSALQHAALKLPHLFVLDLGVVIFKVKIIHIPTPFSIA